MEASEGEAVALRGRRQAAAEARAAAAAALELRAQAAKRREFELCRQSRVNEARWGIRGVATHRRHSCLAVLVLQQC